MFKRFARDEDGVIAVVFAVMAVPVIGMAGMGADYVHLVNVRDFMQIQVDTAALGGAVAGREDTSADWGAVVRDNAAMQYGDAEWVASVDVVGQWAADSDEFRVRATIEVPYIFVSIVPGVPDTATVAVESVALLVGPILEYPDPELTQLDDEAGDYNRISLYCYNAEEDTRSELVHVADNAGSNFDFEMPRCGPGEALSYMLHNTRLVRTQPNRWFHPSEPQFQYFTDTRIVDGVETYDMKMECNPSAWFCPANPPSGGWSVLETVVCDTLTECMTYKPSGSIPQGKERQPEQAAQACSPGQFIYYGWEDRPPGMPYSSDDWTHIGWTDRDYDDIVFVIGCPTPQEVGLRNVRLVG